MSQNSAQILRQSLEKKNTILDAIIEQNSIQEDILKEDNLDMDLKCCMTECVLR